MDEGKGLQEVVDCPFQLHEGFIITQCFWHFLALLLEGLDLVGKGRQNFAKREEVRGEQCGARERRGGKRRGGGKCRDGSGQEA